MNPVGGPEDRNTKSFVPEQVVVRGSKFRPMPPIPERLVKLQRPQRGFQTTSQPLFDNIRFEILLTSTLPTSTFVLRFGGSPFGGSNSSGL